MWNRHGPESGVGCEGSIHGRTGKEMSLTALLLATWLVGQGQPSIRLEDLTVPADRLPTGCELRATPSLVPTNPWIGTDRGIVARIAALIEGTPTLPDAPALEPKEARRFFLRFADGVEEAYAATYAESGVTTSRGGRSAARDVSVFAVKYIAPEDARRVPFGRTKRPDRIVLGSIVLIVNGPDPDHPCFETVRAYVHSLTNSSR